MNENTIGKVHWSFWLIGAVGLAFNLVGCLNFVTQMNTELVASMPDTYRAIIEGRPLWGTVAFAIAVFGGVLGCVLLLLRNPIATYVFIASLIGTVLAQIPVLSASNVFVSVWVGWASQFIVGAFLIWYSTWSKGKGWLS